MKGHTIDRCYKIIGLPKDFKPRNESSLQGKTGVNNVTIDQSVLTSDNSVQMQFSSDQIKKLLSLIIERGCAEEFRPIWLVR